MFINLFETHKSYELLENKCLEMKKFQTVEANKVSYFKLLLDYTDFFLSHRTKENTKNLRYHFRNRNILLQKILSNIH